MCPGALDGGGRREILNAGSGRDVSVNQLAAMICRDGERIQHVVHIHPHSEIQKLLCNYDKAVSLLNWKPRVSLEEGIELTRDWLREAK